MQHFLPDTLWKDIDQFKYSLINYGSLIFPFLVKLKAKGNTDNFFREIRFVF